MPGTNPNTMTNILHLKFKTTIIEFFACFSTWYNPNLEPNSVSHTKEIGYATVIVVLFLRGIGKVAFCCSCQILWKSVIGSVVTMGRHTICSEIQHCAPDNICIFIYLFIYLQVYFSVLRWTANHLQGYRHWKYCKYLKL